MSNPSITADKTPWYQWDTGLTVTVSGGEMTECHFANRKQGTAYVQAVINGVARVPDELLQVAAPIKAYGYVSDGAGGQTYIEETFEVIARNIPADYTYTKTAQKTIRDAEAARDEAVQAAKDAKTSELAAADSAVEASTSAQSAGESASAASTSASNAAKSAGDAAKSASYAKAAASKTVEDASELLKTYTDNAKTSADNAATSASNAADAASAASGSATAASTSASEAATSAREAKDAAGNAASDVLEATKANADAAVKSATDAATAKAGAETAARNAESSATAAAKSASDAAASVGEINVIAPKKVATAADATVSNIAVGNNSEAIKGYGNVAIGNNSTAYNESVSIGDGATAATESTSNAVAIGHNSVARFTNSIALGALSACSKVNEVSIGSPATYNVEEYKREITHVSTPTAPTSASTKKYTDDNDAKTLTESKKYTDANASNALVGTVSGKLLHVEDAWQNKPLGLTIDGACKQDGTPSPENPVPIEVVENPVLNVIGRNLLTITDYVGAYNLPVGSDLKMGVSDSIDFDSVTGVFSIKKELFPWTDGQLFATEPLTAGTYNISFNLWSDTGSGAYSIYVTSPDYIVDSVYKSQQSNINDKFLVGRKCSIKNEKVTVNDNQRIAFVAIVNGTTDVTNEFYVETPLVSVAVQDTYAPYVGTSIPITLPAEHPYLAALPDGTHDEIVVDKDGNASLVERVKAITLDDINAASNYEEKANGSDFQVNLGPKFEYGVGLAVSNVCVDGNVNMDDPVNGGVIKGGYVRMTKPEKVTDIASAKAYLIEIGLTAYIATVTTVTYQLGKLDIPSLHETISNVWIEADLTPNCSMTYKQDVNVVIADLTAQIAALKGTNDIVHDDSTASPDDAIDVPDNSETLDVAGTVGEV